MRIVQKISWSELLDTLATLELGSPLHFKTPRDAQVLQLEHMGFHALGQIHNRTTQVPQQAQTQLKQKGKSQLEP